MKKTLLIFGAVVFAIFVVAAIFQPSPSEQRPDSIPVSLISTDHSTYDFGIISMAKGDVVHEFKIKNTGTEDIKIEKIYTSCMCTTAQFIKGEIKKGPFGMQGHGYIPPVNESLASSEEAIIKVVFDPAAHGPAGVGPIKRAIYVEGVSFRLAEFSFAANVIP